jgi:hypothetical protein
MALLDRFFCSLSWHTHFLHTIVISLPRFLSVHTSLILCINKQQSSTIHILRFEKKNWLVQPDFMELIIKWWSEHHIIGDFGNEWRLKLQHMRKN